MRSVPYVLLLALLLTGCAGDEFQDLRDFVKNEGKGALVDLTPYQEVNPYNPVTYDNTAGLPDPFKPRANDLKTQSHGGQNQPDLTRPKEELEEFPLDSLKMVGYLYQNQVGYAVIRSSDGKLHRVKVGNYLGMNFGLIKAVSDTEIKIREMVQDSAGDWSARESTLQLVE